MKYHLCNIIVVCLTIILLLGCKHHSDKVKPPISEANQNSTDNNLPVAGNNAASVSEKQTSQEVEKVEDPYTYLGDIYIEEGKRKYKGYQVSIREKEVQIKDVPHLSDVKYVVVKKDGKQVAQFDRLRYSLGTLTKFAFFNFTSKAGKQLIAEQSINRGYAYWIADFSPNFHVIFNSRKYDIYGDLLPLDINKDGIYEFQMALTTFWFFDGLCGTCSPRIPIIFNYDKHAREYLPANHTFAKYVLQDIEENIARVQKVKKDGGDSMDVYSAILYVVVEYIYAGKEKEAWDFFDKEYTEVDKKERKANIIGTLKQDAVYQYIHRHRI